MNKNCLRQVSKLWQSTLCFQCQICGMQKHSRGPVQNTYSGTYIRAYIALHLGGTPSQKTGSSPPSCLLLDNRLYIKYLRQTFVIRYIDRPLFCHSLQCYHCLFRPPKLRALNVYLVCSIVSGCKVVLDIIIKKGVEPFKQRMIKSKMQFWRFPHSFLKFAHDIPMGTNLQPKKYAESQQNSLI